MAIPTEKNFFVLAHQKTTRAQFTRLKKKICIMRRQFIKKPMICPCHERNHTCSECKWHYVYCRCEDETPKITRHKNAHCLLDRNTLAIIVNLSYVNIEYEKHFFHIPKENPLITNRIMIFTDFPISDTCKYVGGDLSDDCSTYHTLMLSHQQRLVDLIMYTYAKMYLRYKNPGNPVFIGILSQEEIRRYLKTTEFPITVDELMKRMKVKENDLLYQIDFTRSEVSEDEKTIRITTSVLLPNDWSTYIKLYESIFTH